LLHADIHDKANSRVSAIFLSARARKGFAFPHVTASHSGVTEATPQPSLTAARGLQFIPGNV
jgi:hypothetical protein